MTCISTIDIQTRLDVQELLSHFSHFLDHDKGSCFADLFTSDGQFECSDGHSLQGGARLATLPSLVNERGHGAWRHIITATLIERLGNRKELLVRAYCPVLDTNLNSAVAAFYEIEFTLRFTSRWRIRHAMVNRVGTASDNVGVAAVAYQAPSQPVLQ